MKCLLLFISVPVVIVPSFGQTASPLDLKGTWRGALVSTQGREKEILYISAENAGAMIDPETGSTIAITSIVAKGSQVAVRFQGNDLSLDATLSPDGSELIGQFSRGKTSGTANWTRRPQPSAFADGYQKEEFMIPVRDGVKLHTFVFSPKSHTEPLPFLINRSPYGYPDPGAFLKYTFRDLAADGYIFVFQDVRGRYESQGQWLLQRPIRDRNDPKSIDEATDTYDTIEWLLKNVHGNNGKAGITGISYGGWLTEMALIEPHPALKAASEQASPADMFLGDDFHHNGAFRLSYGFEYAAMMETGKTNKTFDFKQFDTYDWYLKLGPLSEANARYFDGQRPTWNTFTKHPDYDEYWQKQAVQSYVGKGKVPNLNVGGWFDQEDFAGPWRIFRASETPEARQFNYLVVGPWNHGGWANGPGRSLKSVDFGSSTGEYFRSKIQAKWFAYWLKNSGKGQLDMPRIQLFETGLNQWKGYDQWPPAASTQRKLYLSGSGEATFDAPSAAGIAFDSYISDPMRPVPYRERPIPETYGGAPGWSTWHVDDQRFAETRPDVAVWKTKPLEADVTIAGNVVADLFASTSGTDSDWVVKLIDVAPDSVPGDPAMGGYELMITADVLRGRFRNGFSKPEPVRPDEPVEYRIDLLSHDHMFKKGHRIMVQVQSTWFPVIDRNPQTFVPNIFEAKASDFKMATQRIYRDGAHPSAILLPVIP